MTAQFKDVFVYNGEHYESYADPLKELIEFLDLKPADGLTNNRRDYYCDWLIKDNVLHLTKIRSNSIQWEMFFNSDSPIFANWYSGTIALLGGEFILDDDDYNEMFGTYEKEIQLNIEKGKILS